jgi:hypothetical protein
MEKMKALSSEAYKYLEEIPPNQWCRAFFSDFPKCDILLNNNSEVFNKYILDAREMPILSMLERIRNQIINRLYTKQKELERNWPCGLCPKIKRKSRKIQGWLIHAMFCLLGWEHFRLATEDLNTLLNLM